MAAAPDASSRADATEASARALGRVAALDERTASVVELFFVDDLALDETTQKDGGVSKAALAIGLTRLMDALRRFPAWTDDDSRAFARAVDGARAETWRRFETASERSARFANLGEKPTVSARVGTSADDRKAARDDADGNGEASSSSLFARLNGVRRPARAGEASPAPFSSLASAPGLAAASALGSPRRGGTDAAWGVGARADATATLVLRDAFDPESIGLPRAFDAREAFPRCAALVGSVRDQGKCGSCWAVAATEVMNDRLCVKSDGNERRELSPQYALSCFDAGAGCDGGDVLATFRETRARGVPYGGMGIETENAPTKARASRLGRDSREGPKNVSSFSEDAREGVCVPYEFEPCDHPCQVPGTRAARCPSTCADGSDLELVFPASEAYACPPGDWACVAREIQSFGSVAVTFGSVRADFYEHRTGVYRVRDVSDPGLGQHATKLIGWGFDEDEDGEPNPYWLMMNSWRNWGEDGAGRVGVGEMNIESGISAVRM